MNQPPLYTSTDVDANSEFFENKILTRKNKAMYAQNISVKRYHKIPLKTQQTLFEQVFKFGKKIKQVAKELKMNYSSAKSLIHYYKKEKRPMPDLVKKLISKKKEATFCSISTINYSPQKFQVDVKIKNLVVNSYNYFQRISFQVKEEYI